MAVQHCRDTLVSADRCYRAIRHDFVTPNIVEKRRQIIWKLTVATNVIFSAPLPVITCVPVVYDPATNLRGQG